MNDNWEDQCWTVDLNQHVTGWDDWGLQYKEPPPIRDYSKITNDTESLFVYEKINAKMDKMDKLAQEILDYDIDSTLRNDINLLISSIETAKQSTEYLNTRPENMEYSTTPIVSDPILTKFYEMSDIEREWANKKDLF